MEQALDNDHCRQHQRHRNGRHGLPFLVRQQPDLENLNHHIHPRSGKQLPLAGNAGFNDPDGAKGTLSTHSGLNQMVMGIMMISAAPLGTLLLDLLPIYGVLAIDIVTAIIAIVPLLLISSRSQNVRRRQKERLAGQLSSRNFVRGCATFSAGQEWSYLW